MGKIAAYTKAFFNHENYHGWFKAKKYFEGWYFKLVDASGENAIAVIPGIAMDAEGNRQSFIQILDGKKISAVYHKFSPEAFIASPSAFDICMHENNFSLQGLHLDLPACNGAVIFSDHYLWPKKITAPGIMGWYSFVPFMECYHQVVSMDFTLSGTLNIDEMPVDFTGGRGYIEKDWGRSFPSSWIWMQSNHFSESRTSFKLSVAKIPWLSGAFVGFICAFLLDNRLIRFATYTGARLKKVEMGEHTTDIILEDKNYILSVTATKAEGAELASPVLGLMEGRVKESMSALINITLTDKNQNQIIFNDTGRHAGLEIAGNTSELLNFD